MPTYRFADLGLSCDVALAALTGVEGLPVECNVRVAPDSPDRSPESRWDHEWRRPDGSVSLSCRKTRHGYVLGFPGDVAFTISSDGDKVVRSAGSLPPPETLEHLLIDQVLPRVLALRGRLVIHAGGVATDRGVCALLGDSGAGKSTLCAALARRGHPLLGDDGLVVRHARDETPTAAATYPSLRLFSEPLDCILGTDTASSPMAHDSDKRRVAPRPGLDYAESPLPLAAFYVLSPARDGSPAIAVEDLAPRESFMALVRSVFQLHLDDPERGRDLFARLGDLAEAVPVRRLAYRRDLNLLDDVCDAVLADLEARRTGVAVGPFASSPAQV